MEKYVFSKEIGRGSFGKVFLIESRQTGIQYVLKQIDLSKLDKKQAKTASREVEVLSKLKHTHIVRYKESYETANNLNIIMEYCENGDLHKKIKEKRIMNECFTVGEILDFFVQICLALEYIHEENVLHRDIKTKNIFLTKGNLIKLGDFGVAKVLENSFELANTCIGSPYYISPEICENKPYNKKSDIWALGCVLYELSTLKYAFIAKNVKILISKISSGTFNPLPPNVNPQIRSLIINLLKPNPKDRPTASEIVNKPFLQKFRCKYTTVSCSLRMRKRSNSGDSSKTLLKPNNDVRMLSSSCTKLNDLNKRSKFANITLPETKYRVTFFNNKFRYMKKCPASSANGKCNGYGQKTSEQDPKKIGREEMHLMKNSTNGKDVKKFGKMLEVDSEYYKMIAESNQRKEEEEEGVPESVEESRRKWMTSTLEKKELLTILNEAELIDITATRSPQLLLPLDNEQPRLTVDDILKLDPSEISAEVLIPIQVESSLPFTARECENYLSILKDEIRDIKSKFEANNNSYDMNDLIRLTENSKRILTEELTRRCTVDGSSAKNETDSVYFKLELKRMQLEKTVGLNVLLQVFKQMLDMLNGNIRNDVTENSVISGADTYVIRNEQQPDEISPIEKTWMAIIETFGSHQEYIPDMWECAVREIVYY